MPAADFAAAQARLAARRRQIEQENAARRAEREAARSTSSSRLPFPFTGVSSAGLSVWDSIKGREGTRPAFRVGQVDAELLDEELLELLKGQVGEAIKYYGTHLQTDYGAEILLILRAVLFKLTIWDHNASYGASLQGLRYTNARDSSLSRPPPKRWQKSIYGLITVFGRYGWTKWEEYLLDQESGYDAPPASVRVLSSLTSSLSTFHGLTALASFLVFLFNGRYRTVLDRLLSLRLVPTTSHTSRELSFEYLNRQLVWHAFTEFLLFLLPLVGIARWRRILNRTWRRIVIYLKSTFGKRSSQDEEDDEDGGKLGGELGFLPERTCAICYSDQNPLAGTVSESDLLSAGGGSGGGGSGGVVGSAQTDITNPYEAMPCGCVYCFVCLAQRIEAEEGEGWTCLRCGDLVRECKPWNGDVVEEQLRPSSGGGGGGGGRGVAGGGVGGVAGGGHSSGNGKSVGFFDGTGVDGELAVRERPLSVAASDVTMREIDPIPTEDELDTVDEEVQDRRSDVNMTDVDDSAEWARGGSSELVDDSDTTSRALSDDQSDEYEEEEDEGYDDRM